MSDPKKEKTMFEIDEKEQYGELCCSAAEAAEQCYWENLERSLLDFARELELALFQ